MAVLCALGLVPFKLSGFLCIWAAAAASSEGNRMALCRWLRCVYLVSCQRIP